MAKSLLLRYTQEQFKVPIGSEVVPTFKKGQDLAVSMPVKVVRWDYLQEEKEIDELKVYRS